MQSAFFPTRNTQIAGHLKRESGMALKKREFTPESGNVDTYGIHCIKKHSVQIRQQYNAAQNI